MNEFKTYFFVTPDGVYYRRISDRFEYWWQGAGQIALRSNLIIEMSKYGRGKSVKNRESGKTRYFTKNEMVMYALQAEKV